MVDTYKHGMNHEKEVTDPQERKSYRDYMKSVIDRTQLSALAADADSNLLLKGYQRGWMKNFDGTDRIIKYNGRNWTFVAGEYYCLDIQEKSFFMSRAHELGYALISASEPDWIATGANQVYNW
jgi:hypothetical protein